MSIKHGSTPLIISTIFLFIGYMAGYAISQKSLESNEGLSEIRQSSGYTLINPLLECETNTIGNNQKYIPFEDDLIKKIAHLQAQHTDIHLSVYFRNLNNGPWFGIDENNLFSPASLMKLPILFIYLKWKDINPNILKKVLIPTMGNTLHQEYEPSAQIIVGKPYNIEQLLYYLIVHSDNTALNTLIEDIPQELQNKIYSELHIPEPKTIDYVLSVKEFASFFRILYNSSYLSRDSSETALHLLSLSTFTGGITGKLPKDILVAHKFGEREIVENGKIINQLHDCGIIYYTQYPYLVCIMTRGETDIANLSEIIQDTSKLIFDEIVGIYKK